MKEVDIISKVVGRDTSGKTAMYIPGAGAPSVNLDDYLLKKIWDSVFEIRTDGEGNPYLFEKLPLVTQYGITMYADGGELNLPSIYAGLPIDNSTLIRDENGVLMINPDIDLGGGLTEVYWNDIKAKPTFATVATSGKYADLGGLPDLSVYATTEYLTAELKKYVTLNTEQTIAAHKNFLNGLSVGGLGITKSQDDVVYIDANLVVRGGITMYATDTVDVPSIIDSLPTASTSAKGLASFDPNFFSVDDNGNVSFIGSTGGVDESILADYAKKTDLSAYLSLNGGQMTGNIGYTLSPDSYVIGLPAAGSFSINSNFLETLSYSKSFIGSCLDESTSIWDHVISIRHRNGLDDGYKYGIYLRTRLTTTDNLAWDKQIDGRWQGERVILDSVNWSQYVTATDGGNYLPLSGGTLTQGSQSNTLTVQSTMAASTWLTPVRTYTPNVQKGGHCNIEVGKVGTSRNLAWFGFKYDSDGSYNNLLTIGLHSVDDALVINGYGHVGIGTLAPEVMLHVAGNTKTYSLYVDNKIQFKTNGDYFDDYGNIWLSSKSENWNVFNNAGTQLFAVNVNGNVLAAGGITMYSDIRKKTKLQDVELSLKQIADAPLIEHYYNSDSNKTTHVGSIAQYWAGLNDWFCKLDSEGFYTMEIQNAALASAISIAKELSRYESRTDKEIRLLKDEVKRLKKKIKILKSA